MRRRKRGRVAVGTANRELLHLEAAAIFDNCVEDPLHDVRIDQVPLRFHNFGNGKIVRCSLFTHGAEDHARVRNSGIPSLSA